METSTSKKKYFAGIGSRETLDSLFPVIQNLSKKLISLNFVLRSGGADGSDSFWEKAYDSLGGEKEIYLPWKGFNNNLSPLYEIKDWALERAEMYHPNWNRLSPAAQKLHSRNVYQVQGYNDYWDEISDFVICYTPDGKDSGGTGQAIRIARQMSIPVFNLYNDREENIDSFLTLNYSEEL